MMHMLYSQSGLPWLALLWVLHIFSVIAFSVGLLFLIALALKTFTHAQLRLWSLWLIIGGTLLCLFTIGVMGHPWGHGSVRLMRGDSDDGWAPYGKAISGNGMTMMLQGKTGDDFDRTFLQMMVPHHQGAIDMAKLAEQNAKHAEVKAMAEGVISAQQREIDQMHQWQKDWGYTR